MVTKIALDTNIIISAFGWKGAPNKILKKCMDGNFQLCVSPAILFEIEKVLSYKKFKFNHEEKEEFISIILETAEIIEPEIIIEVIDEDPSDNMIIECAVAGECEYIVSGDRHLLKIGKFDNIAIVSPNMFLTLIKGGGG